MSRASSLLLPLVVLASAGAHAVAWAIIDDTPRPRAPRPPALVEMTVAPRPTPKPEPPPRAEPPPQPPPEARTAPRLARTTPARPAPAPTPAPTPPPEPPPSAAPPPPADFTGTTLTNDSGDAWASATGNGAPMNGPIGPAAPAPRPRPRATAPGGTGDGTGTGRAPGGPPVVALGDLSRPPRAPALDDELAHNYPAEARARGASGKAVVRARIGADGRATVLAVVSESAAGFGAACRRTVEGSRWQPPLDKDGTAVATELTYTCRFEVQ